MEEVNRLFLNSIGFNEVKGTFMLKRALSEFGMEDLSEKTIYIVSLPEYEVDEKIQKNCKEILGFSKENMRFSEYKFPDYNFVPDFIYVTEGNTFEVLQYMRKYGIDNYIKEVMKNDTTIYIGSSAGAMIAGSDIMLAKYFESNFVGMYDFSALGLFEGAILPHTPRERLHHFLELTDQHVVERYPIIYSVSNQEVAVLDLEEE